LEDYLEEVRESFVEEGFRLVVQCLTQETNYVWDLLLEIAAASL
jgi:hypothetical protein